MKLYSEGTNIVSLKLTTASAITDEMKNQLASSIVKNAKVEIKTVVDPSIIGGFIAEFNNQMLDESISTKINKLKQKINS
jgi:F-type H+-transporting ATPase subunit delta